MGLFNQILLDQRADFSSSLVGWWTFDDGTGTTAFDSSPSRIAMTMSVSNPPLWTTSSQVGGYALNFSGSSYIQTQTDPALLLLAGTQSFTEACWFKTRQTPTQSIAGICMSHAGQFDGQYEKGLGVTQNGNAGAYTYDASGIGARLLSGSTKINDGNWHHVCSVFNGITKTYQLYVDGRLENYQSHQTIFQYSSTAFLVCSFAFGTGGGLGTWETFSGSIDDVRFYNRVLTPQDVLSLYRFSQPDLNMGLTLYLKFDEGSGTTAIDSSGNGHTGTYEHSPAFVAGKIGPYAIKTSTTNDLISVSPAVNMTGSYTIATWTMLPTAVGNLALTRCGVNSGSGNVHVASVAQFLGVYKASDGSAFHTSGYNTLTASAGWHHLTAVGSGSITTFYIDAQFVGTASAQANDNLDTIGNNIQNSNQPWGTFDDFRIYKRALTQADITALYNFR